MFVHEHKLLFFFKQEYNTWMFPQGAIENKTQILTALTEKMREEVGTAFFNSCDPNFILAYQESLVFKKNKHGLKNLHTDDGKYSHMLGKHYYFYVINAPSFDLDISKTPFDNHFWLDYSAGKTLMDKAGAKKKGQVVIRALDSLKNQGYIN